MIARIRARWETLPRPVRWLLIAAFVLFIAGPVTSAVAYFIGRKWA